MFPLNSVRYHSLTLVVIPKSKSIDRKTHHIQLEDFFGVQQISSTCSFELELNLNFYRISLFRQLSSSSYLPFLIIEDHNIAT